MTVLIDFLFFIIVSVTPVFQLLIAKSYKQLSKNWQAYKRKLSFGDRNGIPAVLLDSSVLVRIERDEEGAIFFSFGKHAKTINSLSYDFCGHSLSEKEKEPIFNFRTQYCCSVYIWSRRSLVDTVWVWKTYRQTIKNSSLRHLEQKRRLKNVYICSELLEKFWQKVHDWKIAVQKSHHSCINITHTQYG